MRERASIARRPRWRDVGHVAEILGADNGTLVLEECGVRALPIVSLISFLVGVILAYVGVI